jgi:hypothetical protein
LVSFFLEGQEIPGAKTGPLPASLPFFTSTPPLWVFGFFEHINLAGKKGVSISFSYHLNLWPKNRTIVMSICN